MKVKEIRRTTASAMVLGTTHSCAVSEFIQQPTLLQYSSYTGEQQSLWCYCVIPPPPPPPPPVNEVYISVPSLALRNISVMLCCACCAVELISYFEVGKTSTSIVMSPVDTTSLSAHTISTRFTDYLQSA